MNGYNPVLAEISDAPTTQLLRYIGWQQPERMNKAMHYCLAISHVGSRMPPVDNQESLNGGFLKQGDAPDILNRPVIILVGHAGSGKSEIAVNLAFGYAACERKAVLVDLDVVKPYFRSRLVRGELSDSGIEVVIPEGENLYADTPIIPAGARKSLSLDGFSKAEIERVSVIVDVGGNDNGARIVGSLSSVIKVDQTELLFVLNANRPLTGNMKDMSDMVRDINQASGMEITGLVSNTHLMDDTTPEIVKAGLESAKILSQETGIPIRFYCVPKGLSSLPINLKDEGVDYPWLVLDRYILPPHSRPRRSGRAEVL